MENLVLSILILGVFFGFLLIVSHLAILQLLKNWKLHRSNKQYDGIRQGHKPIPIFIQRNQNDSLHDFDSVEEWQDMGVLSSTERSTYRERFKTDRRTNT